MKPAERSELENLLRELTGQDPHLVDEKLTISWPSNGLGHSQLNELLLLFGYDRVNESFFQYLVDGEIERQNCATISSLNHLKCGIERVQKLSLLFWGNIKFGFKLLGQDEDQLNQCYYQTQKVNSLEYMRRHDPISPIEVIPSEKTYYLGYIVQKELDEKLNRDPNNKEALHDKEILEKIREVGIKNQQAYLASDHLDVYVATSMRCHHEYIEISEFTSLVFKDSKLKELKLRWFDPTQAYCHDRIDKGLSEALMLKRAKCTLYLAQELDTLGKDSELACTLAQGKPVIAYIPDPTKEDIEELVKKLSDIYKKSEQEIILERLKTLQPGLAWEDSAVKSWISDPNSMTIEVGMERLIEVTQSHYNRRAITLKESHPLGIQVNLDTGVANGVLVVRNAPQCAELIYKIVTSCLEFSVHNSVVNGRSYYFLKEKISGSIFRVMTGDVMLTNCFWNFYFSQEGA